MFCVGDFLGDGGGSLDRRLVTPDSQHGPSHLAQTLVGVRIASPIRFDLLPPELRVPFGPSGMYRTAMPKTPIDENGDLEAGEGNVGDAPWLRQHHLIDAATQPQPEEFPAQHKFRIRVLLAHPRHATAGVCRGWGYARH